MKSILRQFLVGAFLAFTGSAVYAADHIVRVGQNGLTYSPAQLTIQRGDTVTFMNVNGNHNVVADSGAFRCARGCDGVGTGNGNLSSTQWSAAVQFNNAGTFGYYCEAHGAPGSGMAGSITVQDTTPTFTITPAITGNWYDPAQNGHGFQFEMITPTLVTAFWFTFDGNGNPSWLVGTGNIDGNRIVMQVNRSSGGRFPPNFNPASIVANPWGTWTFTFTSCTSGKVDWTSTDPAYTATGTMQLTRLTQIQGLTCP